MWLADEVGRNWIICWSLAAIVFALAMTPVAGNHASASLTPFEAMARNVLYAVIATAVLVPGVFGPQDSGVVHRLMCATVPAYLGTISYGIFLWHLILAKPAIALTGHRIFAGGSVPVLTVTLLLAVAAAALSYHLVEQPVMRLKNRVPTGRSPQGPPDETAAADGSARGLAAHDTDVGVGVEAQR